MKTKLLLIIALTTFTAIFAQNTMRHNLVPRGDTARAENVAGEVMLDTIVHPQAHTVDITGYDKPLRSRRETFFVTNNGTQTIRDISFTLNYYDKRGEQLHSRSIRLPLDIPAGETRQASLKSWDQQLSFYYIKSTVPARVEQATPYDVKISTDTIFCLR